jgi:hypothetical protein
VEHGTPRRQVVASRFAWELTFGPIPKDLEVCHNCPGGDNPACCNPAHLFLGTRLENMQDMVRKGRTIRRAGVAGVILDPESVRAIRKRRSSGEQYKAIAHDFGIGANTARDVAKRRRWQNVT